MALVVNANGRLGRDAEIVKTSNGEFVTFSLATDDYVDGKETTVWINVAYGGERAIKMAQYFKKGSLVNISGKLHASIYTDKSGQSRIDTRVSAYDVQFVKVGSGTTSDDSSIVKAQPEATGTPKKKNQPTTTKKAKTTSAIFNAALASAANDTEEEDELPF